jgi:hypothetical protein
MSSGHNCTELHKFYEYFEIKECYHNCPLFQSNGNEMWCGHPQWKTAKSMYDSYIITHDNSKDGNIPEECPLRKNTLVRSYVISNKIKGTYLNE